MAAIKLAQTKDELAFLIGHELAHNILHYKNFDANEANLLAIDYLDKPYTRFKNKEEEQETFFIKDPHGNVLELKTLKN